MQHTEHNEISVRINTLAIARRNVVAKHPDGLFMLLLVLALISIIEMFFSSKWEYTLSLFVFILHFKI
jgi:hypothetical protein